MTAVGRVLVLLAERGGLTKALFFGGCGCGGGARK